MQPSSLTRTLVVNELKEELRRDTTEVVRLNIEVDRTLVEERPGMLYVIDMKELECYVCRKLLQITEILNLLYTG